jgi:D-sedoheptulose 7-phosphate isomerase
MSVINKLSVKNKNIANFAESYFQNLIDTFKKLDKESIIKLEREFLEIRKKNATLYVFGNGGGAATAMTMANDLGFDVLKKTNKKTFKIVSLNDNSSVITAIANDTGYDNIFVNQLKIHFKKNDKILIFSASGNSKNLIDAANWVKKKGGKVMSILGFDGGKLKKISNLTIHIRSEKGDYGPVEDSQLIINHIMAHWFQKNLK